MFTIREKFREAHPDIAKMLESEKYDFLRTNEHLDDNICLLGLGGSHAYGTNVEGSDVDIRGVAVNRVNEILGTENFEQFENRETDTVVYGLKKFFSLLAACNPNIVEIVGLRPEDYIYISPIGQMILDNMDLFLSKRAAASFGGYANAQLRRIQSATARDRLPQHTKNKHISSSMQNAMDNLIRHHELEKYGSIRIYADEASGEVVLDAAFTRLPAGEFIDMTNTVRTVKLDYEKSAGNRNHKKDDLHMNKHANHLCRLYHMAIEILRDHKVNTYRTWDHGLLMDIRNGKYMDEKGLFTDAFYDYVEKLEHDLELWKTDSTLPQTPDHRKINELLMFINRQVVMDSER